MKYIVAVSGGLDSVALLHMLATNSSHELIVAHVDHGIRSDSSEDARHVAALARNYNLPFELKQLTLGPHASEALARQERYAWLHELRTAYAADAVVTAHHQDDQLETVVLNLMRGTGWRGLASLQSSTHLYRPLLDVPKISLVKYSVNQGLQWRDDSTNDDLRYTRNYIRHAIMPRLSLKTRARLVALARAQRHLRQQLETEAVRVLSGVCEEAGLSRHQLIMMPDNVALELLRQATNGQYEPSMLRRLLHFVKTGRKGALLPLGKGDHALLTRQHLVLDI